MYLFCYERILVCKDSSFPLKEKEKTMKYPKYIEESVLI